MTDTPVIEPVKSGFVKKLNDLGYVIAVRIVRLGFRCSHSLALPVYKLRLLQRKIWVWFYKRRRLLINKEQNKQEDVFIGAIMRGENHNVAILLARDESKCEIDDRLVGFALCITLSTVGKRPIVTERRG